MNPYYKQYLEYIRNTGGSPTKQMFIEDWEPIGQAVIDDLLRLKLIMIKDNKIVLTDQGRKEL